MHKLKREELMSLEEYARKRPDFRAQIIRHKLDRRLAVGPHATLHFEDRMTMQYQVQEMLRAERIFEEEGIQEELDAYNPLIPDGSNWKATFMIEYDDPAERQQALARLVGIEDKVWMQVDGHARVYPIADEDLERETADKTSSVHFLRFELEPGMCAAVRKGATVSLGIDHPEYQYAIEPLPANVRDSLAGDLE